MGILYHAGNASVQIMSSRELATHFGIARSTVSLALKELVDDGFLIPKRGIGNFTNPKMFSALRKETMPPLIGILQESGRNFFVAKSGWESLQATCDAVVREGYNLRCLQLSGSDEDEVFEEIMHSQVDALIWIDNIALKESLMKRLADAGLPVICDNSDFSQVDTVVYDTNSACYEIGREFAEKNVPAILYALPEWFVKHDLRIMKQGYLDAGKECRITIASEWEKSGASLKDYFQIEKKGVVIVNSQRLSLFRELADQCHTDFTILDYLQTFSGSYVFPHEERARIMLERLKELGLGKRTPKQQLIPLKFLKYNS